MLPRKSTRGVSAAPRWDGNAVRSHAESNGGRDDVAVFVKVADREYGVANYSKGAQALGLVFWVNVGAGTLVAADEGMTQNCAFDTLYVGVPARRLC